MEESWRRAGGELDESMEKYWRDGGELDESMEEYWRDGGELEGRTTIQTVA